MIICRNNAYKDDYMQEQYITDSQARAAAVPVDEGNEEEEEDEPDEDDEEDKTGEYEELLEKVKEQKEENKGRIENELLMQFFKEVLHSKPCQNQGFILEGFPKTFEQAKDIFAGETLYAFQRVSVNKL